MRVGAALVMLCVGCGTSEKDSAPAVDPGCHGSAAPSTIAEMVDHLNSLPPPVTVPCLLDSLARPLEVELTENPVSAQPADGPESPRIFLFTGDLVTSMVASGDGSLVLEFGEVDGLRHTRKGEVVVPVTAPLLQSDPYTRIEHDELGTVCAACHIEQTDHPDGGTTSIAIAPDPRSRISVSELREVAEACPPRPTSGPCLTLNALFDGAVVHRSFPAAYPTIFELTE